MNGAPLSYQTVCFTFVFVSALSSGQQIPARSERTVDQRSPTLDESVRQLRDTGRKIAAAVLKHDIETILAYDRPDLRDGDRLSFQDTKDELYCAVFDRACNWLGRASVYDILSGAKRLEIDVQVMRAKGKGFPPYGLMLFFDGAKIIKAKLRSASYLCQLERRSRIVSWTFALDEKGGWISAHPPFDLETDGLC